MILIITNNNEPTTNEVIKWLISTGKSFLRIHEDEIFNIKVNNKRVYLESNEKSFYLDEIVSVWYRRGALRFDRVQYNHPSINQHMIETQYWLEDYVLKTLESKKHINKQSRRSVNKLWVLDKAKEIGLNVPKFFLSDNMREVVVGETITKAIAEGGLIMNIDKDVDGMMYTAIVEKRIKKEIFISFFQEKIEKDFEIRSFYLNEKIWSFAIISQNDEQTKLDFRKYNYEKPNRNVRYNLPKELEIKICKLMKTLDLNSGSLDFIKSGKEFYFLEVNPIGQFSGFSLLCNENLEKEVANYL